jgi:NADH dehydrogenase [ubiquinone] 1 alpha subcomplex assembly factor 6
LPFIPGHAQSAYLAIRAFNVEVARVADTASTPQVGALRLQFWKDTVNKTLEGYPPKQPVSILLASALDKLAKQTHGEAKLSKSWLLRVVTAREQYLNNNPYPSMEALERYAESTYSTLLYLTLQALPMNSLTTDHIASHIGKAVGIVAVLRGLPLLAFPALPNHHSNNAGLSGVVAEQRSRSQQGVVTLPLDVMAEVGLREEDVLRKGGQAEGVKDAVFKVATRASDHLITARSMIDNLRKGQGIGHEFEHADEEEHVQGSREVPFSDQLRDIHDSFGVFMPAVSTELWLKRLQKVDFDIFHDSLRRREWKLPFAAYLAHSRKKF